MQLEVGNIVDGKVTGITNFGAFIALPEGKTGMIHISEISDAYVKDINDYLEEDEDVKVKILSIADDGKIGLSIKTLQEENGIEPQENRSRPRQRARRPQPRREERASQEPQQRQSGPPQSTWAPRPAPTSDDMSFEDMLNRFKQNSNDRIGDIKHLQDNSRRRGGQGGR